MYRSILLGRDNAVDSPIATVLYDRDGDTWYKTSSNTWKSTANPGLTWSDATMDSNAEQDSVTVGSGGITFPRRGILDTKRVMTSDLIPSLTQTTRALHCRIDSICLLAGNSSSLEPSTTPSPLTVQIEGCVPFTWESLTRCQFANDENTFSQEDVYQYCKKVSDRLLVRENSLLLTIVEYDAAYRSILQFAGVFDEFLLEYRWMITGKIRWAASIIGWLQGIPCFLSSCDEYPPPQCNDGNTDSGETCGEPDLPSCPTGQTCESCTCVGP